MGSGRLQEVVARGGSIVAGVRCNVTGEYFEKGSTSEKKIVIGYRISVRFLGSKPRILRSLMANKHPVMSTMYLDFSV